MRVIYGKRNIIEWLLENPGKICEYSEFLAARGMVAKPLTQWLKTEIDP